MLVKILNFGTNWWARFGHDPADRYRYTRHAAYYNSTGVRCGRKVRRHWIVPGLIRFNGIGDFNPHLPERAIQSTFACAGPTPAFGGNRLLFGKRLPASVMPERYLVVISAGQHGRINFRSCDWKAASTSIIAASNFRDKQETMLLMKAGDWVRTGRGLWRLEVAIVPPFRGALELMPGALGGASRLP